MKCFKCDKEIPEGSKFCNHCGCTISANDGYIDLGLPSGTKWKAENEKGYYEFDEAVSKYGNRLPTLEQLEELRTHCQWEWMGDGYRVTGPNGNAIVLPAAGYRYCSESVSGVGSGGYFWSSTPDGSDFAWYLYFDSSSVGMYVSDRCYGFSVRLVQD